MQNSNKLKKFINSFRKKDNEQDDFSETVFSQNELDEINDHGEGYFRILTKHDKNMKKEYDKMLKDFEK